ncbi:hypothetical protein RRG08_019203 [Elysia crispata]|uniref:Uncharacterized protein n=1 Tax=Elysia crispata TaxID=231223 RepID=A0AAE1ATQ3_9GAST|nr:hypothetical protein RRG08_019203 [Elysia crispata]
MENRALKVSNGSLGSSHHQTCGIDGSPVCPLIDRPALIFRTNGWCESVDQSVDQSWRSSAQFQPLPACSRSKSADLSENHALLLNATVPYAVSFISKYFTVWSIVVHIT